jgi:hypothetical protein
MVTFGLFLTSNRVPILLSKKPIPKTRVQLIPCHNLFLISMTYDQNYRSPPNQPRTGNHCRTELTVTGWQERPFLPTPNRCYLAHLHNNTCSNSQRAEIVLDPATQLCYALPTNCWTSSSKRNLPMMIWICTSQRLRHLHGLLAAVPGCFAGVFQVE